MTIDYEDKKPMPFDPETLVPVSSAFVKARNNLEKVRSTFTNPFSRLAVRSMEKLVAAETAFVEEQTRHIEAVTARTHALQRQAEAIVESAVHSPEEREKNIELKLELAEFEREQARLDNEHRRALADLERKREILEKEKELAIAEGKKRGVRRFGEGRRQKPEPEPAAELSPEEHAEFVYEHGVAGKHVLAAEAVAAKRRAEADTLNFTEPQRRQMEESIETMFEDARRKDLSQGA